MTAKGYSGILLVVLLVGFLAIRAVNSQGPGTMPVVPWNHPSPASTANASMLMNTNLLAQGNQVILIDSTRKVMAVYMVSPDSGSIQLKSVRDLQADFQLEEFNGSDPSPAKVRGILGQPRP